MEDQEQTLTMLDEFRLHAFTTATVIPIAVILIVRFLARKVFNYRKSVKRRTFVSFYLQIDCRGITKPTLICSRTILR